jgi:hypothetical protein
MVQSASYFPVVQLQQVQRHTWGKGRQEGGALKVENKKGWRVRTVWLVHREPSRQGTGMKCEAEVIIIQT